jgi:hypothetical protein
MIFDELSIVLELKKIKNIQIICIKIGEKKILKCSFIIIIIINAFLLPMYIEIGMN